MGCVHRFRSAKDMEALDNVRIRYGYLTCKSDRKEWDSWRFIVPVLSDAVLNNV